MPPVHRGLSPLLSVLINNSIETGRFPDSLKTARVLPLFKGGEILNIANYRPISLLHILSKIYEKAVKKQLVAYLDKFKILSPSQFGFQQNISTTNAILSNLQNIYDQLDSGN